MNQKQPTTIHVPACVSKVVFKLEPNTEGTWENTRSILKQQGYDFGVEYSGGSNWAQRALEEKGELDSRLGKLMTFMESVEFYTLDAEVQGLLYVQAHIMQQYSDILAQRLQGHIDLLDHVQKS